MIKIKRRWELPESEVTPESIYHQRRKFIQTGAAGALALSPVGAALAGITIDEYEKGVITLDEKLTDMEDAVGL